MADKSLTTNIEVEVDARYDDQRDVGGDVQDHLDYDLADKAAPTKLFSGTGDTSANRLYHSQLSLNSTNSYTKTLDVSGGINDAFGDALALSEVKGLLVHNRATSVGDAVSVGGATSALSSWVGDGTDKLIVGPQGTAFAYNPQDGYAVTAGSGDELKFDSAPTEITVDVVLFGDE